MAFSVNLLTTTAQCDELLAAKQRERDALNLRLTTLTHQLDHWNDVTSVAAELTTTQTFVSSLTPLIAALPDGDEKRRQQNLLNRYESRANNLTSKVENYGAVAKLEKELDRDEATAALAVLDSFIAAVTARRAQL